MPKEQAVSYRDFNGGEFGQIGAFAAPPGTFHAKNLVRSRAGYLYPRHGAEGPYPTSGLPNGEVHAMGWAGVPGRDTWALVNDTVYHRNGEAFSSGSWTAATGTLDTEPNEQVSWMELTAGIVYMLVPGQGLWRLDLATGSPGTLTKVSAVSAEMAGRPLARWGDRLVIGGWDPANRVYYSAQGDFGSWPAANYFDVGPAPQVRVLLPQRQHLAIALQDGSWWVMNGSTPATGTLRQIIAPQGTWHFWQNSAVVAPDDKVWLIPNQGSWPAMMDGVEVQDLTHLEYASPQGSIQGEQNVVAPLSRRSDVAYISGRPGERGESMIQLDGTWTYHRILGSGDVAGGVAADGQGHVWLHDGGAAGSPPNVWRLNLTNDGLPGGVGADSRVGDGSSTPLDAWLELPGWWAEDGQEWMVRQVVVNVVKFDLGIDVDNELSMVVDAYSHEQAAAARSTATKTWTEDTAEGSTTGVRDRIVWNVGEQGPGQGFQVRFPSIVGLAIQEVVVKLEATADQPRS